MINNNLQIGHERKPALANLQVVSIQHTLAYAWCEGQSNIS